MAMDYLKEGEKEILRDGTLVEHGEKGIVVHNVPNGKGVFKDAVLEAWIDALIENKDHTVKDTEGVETLTRDSILDRVVRTCSTQWGIAPEKITEALEIIYIEEDSLSSEG